MRVEVDCEDEEHRSVSVARDEADAALISWFDHGGNELRLRLPKASADWLAQSLLGFMRDDGLHSAVSAALEELAQRQEEQATLERGLDALDEPDEPGARVATADLLERLRTAMIVRDAAHEASL
jgi:hypothetical protein